MRLTPYPDQQKDIDRVLAEPTKAALIAANTGWGKTIAAIEVARGLAAQTVLVVCPLNTRIGWERTVTNQELGLGNFRVDSTKKGKAAFEALQSGQPGVFLVGWEYFRRLDWARVKPDLMVLDESHKAQSRKSKTWGVLRKVKPKFRLALSATPAGNKFEGLWTTTRWLWPDAKKQDGTHYVNPYPWKWAIEWAKVEFCPFAGKKMTGERIPGAYVASLPCYLRPEPRPTNGVQEENIIVELLPAQRKMYRQMEEQMVAWLDDNPLVAELPIVKRARLRQMALGTVTLTDDDMVEYAPDCKSVKIDVLQELLDQHEDQPVLVYTHSAKFARVVAERIGGLAWTGALSHKDREHAIKTFGTPEGPQYIVATIEAVGLGVDGLQHNCHIEVWLSESDNGVANQQAEGRLHRTGQDETVLRYKIVAADTLDEGVMGTLLSQRLAMRSTLALEEVDA